MNNHSLSYKRYWEPSYFQTASVSLIAGAVASWVTYPAEFIKTSIQHQAVAIGFRGRRGTVFCYPRTTTGIQSFQDNETIARNWIRPFSIL